jgi:hypothetical protein
MLNSLKKIVYILLSSIILLSACSIKKRSYRNGYYIDWVNKTNKNKEQEKIAKRTTTKKVNLAEQDPVLTNTVNKHEIATINSKMISKQILLPKKLLLLNDTCGDIINLRSGDMIIAKVIEINETQIKYKRCNNIDGPLIVINKNDVYSIKYTNGITDNFIKTNYVEPNTNRRKENTNTTEKKVHPLAWVTLACTIGIFVPLLGFLSLIAALIIAGIGTRKILAEPNKYTGLDIIRGCQIALGIFLTLALILVVLILLAI